MKRLAATPVTFALLALPAAAPTWTADEYFKSGRLWVDVRAYGAHVALIGKGNVGDSFGATQNTIVLGSDCTTMAGAAIIRPEWKQLARRRITRPRRLRRAISEVLEEREAPEIRGVTVGGGGLHADGFAQGGTLATTIGINRRTGRMAKFTIQPHGRLQEWIAHDKGYFHAEGLDYEFRGGLSAERTGQVDASGKVIDVLSGAFEAYQQGRGNKGVKSDISCACHWAVSQASARQIGTMWRNSYVVTPGGIMVPPDSPIRTPEDLADREVAVGYHSGSHFTTIQALEPFLDRARIKLKFVGSSWARVDVGVERRVPATSVWGIAYLALDQLGFRKIVDTTFMIAFMFPGGTAPADVEKYMRALKCAQMDLDLEPERYKHFYLNEVPDRYRSALDVRRFSTGERVVFLPYSDETYAKTQAWIHERGIFDEPDSTEAASAAAR